MTDLIKGKRAIYTFKRKKTKGKERGGERREEKRQRQRAKMREKSEVRGVQSQCVSIDQAVQIDGRLDEYLPGRACAELSRDGRPRCRRDKSFCTCASFGLKYCISEPVLQLEYPDLPHH